MTAAQSERAREREMIIADDSDRANNRNQKNNESQTGRK